MTGRRSLFSLFPLLTGALFGFLAGVDCLGLLFGQSFLLALLGFSLSSCSLTGRFFSLRCVFRGTLGCQRPFCFLARGALRFQFPFRFLASSTLGCRLLGSTLALFRFLRGTFGCRLALRLFSLRALPLGEGQTLRFLAGGAFPFCGRAFLDQPTLDLFAGSALVFDGREALRFRTSHSLVLGALRRDLALRYFAGESLGFRTALRVLPGSALRGNPALGFFVGSTDGGLTALFLCPSRGGHPFGFCAGRTRFGFAALFLGSLGGGSLRFHPGCVFSRGAALRCFSCGFFDGRLSFALRQLFRGLALRRLTGNAGFLGAALGVLACDALGLGAALR